MRRRSLKLRTNQNHQHKRTVKSHSGNPDPELSSSTSTTTKTTTTPHLLKKHTNHKTAIECSKTEPLKLSTTYRYWYYKWYPLAPGLCYYGYQCFDLFLVVVRVRFLYWYWSQELLRTILHCKKIFLTLKSP